MTKRLFLAIALTLLAGCQRLPAHLSVTPVPAAETPARRVPISGFSTEAQAPVVLPDRVIVSLARGVKTAAFLSQPPAAGFSLLADLELSGRTIMKLGLPEGVSVEEAKARLQAVPGVTRATEDYLARPAAYTFTQADPFLGAQWAHSAPFADTVDAWDKVPVAQQSKVIVAVLDTGMDVGHPEFTARVIGVRNFTTGGSPNFDVRDSDGHGTHVAGIIGARGDNGVGVAGVAWGATIMPVKVLGGEAGGFDVIRGMQYAYKWRPTPENGTRVRVINMSLGSASGSADAFYTEAIAEAKAAGVLVVAATGNDGRSIVSAPANSPGCLAVGATGSYLFWESLSSFSNYGDRLDITAPGEDILSTIPLDKAPSADQAYGYKSGTSMATPYVSGVAALLASKYDPNNTQMNGDFVEKMRQRLLRAVDDLGEPGWDPSYGEGRLDAGKAVTPASIDVAP